MLTLYYSPGACSFASHIALYDAGADFEARRVNFKATEQRSDPYLKINPKGRVPALVTDQGVLTESPAILTYIADTHREARLAPFSDPWSFAQLRSFIVYLCSTVHVAHAHKQRGSRWANEESSFADMRSKVTQNMSDCFSLIERDMLRGPWVFGENYTIADPYLFTFESWLEGDGVDIRKFPRVAEHFERMKARDSVKRAMAAEAA